MTFDERCERLKREIAFGAAVGLIVHLAFVALLMLAGCARREPTVLRSVSTTIEPMRCRLPALPEPAQLVGFPWFAPSNLALYVTKSDMTDLYRELNGWRSWAQSVSQCVGAE